MTVSILIGDVRDRLRTMPAESVDCVVTSPPYWGLRDYDVDGQIGLEPTLAEHLTVMVEVFEEVRRVLKPTGTLWLNYGDCYATAPNGRSAAEAKAVGGDDRTFRDKPFSTIGGVLKPKDLCMVPNRLAIALQEAGWWVRSEIIWAKPNPMPESVKDRPASSHEKIFLLSKAPHYYYDAAAVRQEAVGQTAHDLTGGRYAPPGQPAHSGTRTARRDSFARVSKDTPGAHGQKPQNRPDREDIAYPRGAGRSLRNWEPASLEVWPIATRPFSEAHFATFPPELAERCILAGAPAKCCSTCGAPVVRAVETELVPTAKAAKRNVVDDRDGRADRQDAGSNRAKDGHVLGWSNRVTTTGFAKSCACVDPGTVPGVVLDPFGGAGTTALVADRHGLDCTIIELNPKYAEIARRRLSADQGLFAQIEVAA
ncbi:MULTISPECIES: DNA-methyltransferase [Brevundimonas]|uniref:DNA-methyltransferase n=1 Tax=Brevundimonas sp. UBA7507 TaxID=1946137 RepID=UPI00257C1934|nr:MULTISPECIES: site-specific DNA-methyltransferase [Brevundimonas]